MKRPIKLIALAAILASLTQTGNAQIKMDNRVPEVYPRLGLLSFWPANGNTRDIVSRHDGYLMNKAGYTNGVAGSAFNFDNATGITEGWSSAIFPPPAFDGGNYVTVADSPDWNLKDFTVTCWTKFNALPAYDIGHSQGGVFISHDDGAFDARKWWFALGGGVLNVHINDPVGGPQWLLNTPFTPELNRWYHFALTRKGNSFTVFVNGSPIGSDSSSRALPDAGGPLNIGEAEGYYLNGRMDNIAIYKRALAAKDIKRIASSGPNP